MATAPNGWFVRNLLYFGREAGQPAWLARGATLSLPDLRQADASAQEARYAAVRGFLCSLLPGEAVQFQWSREGDYSAELEKYARLTKERAATGWCRLCREERHRRYERRLREGTLHRERVDVYLSARMPALANFAAESEFEARLEQEALSAGARFAALETSLEGARVAPMDDAGHFAAWREFLQPSVRLQGGARLEGLDPERSILENCVPSDGVFLDGDAPCLRLDGHYHALIVVRQWPQQTWFGCLWPLLDAAASNLRVTLVCRPVEADALVRREEDDIRRLEGQAATERKPSLLAVAARKRAKVAELQSGATRPYAALLVVRVWDATLDGLARQAAAVKAAIHSISGARHHQADQPAQARNLFFETLPGWFGGTYRAWDRTADSNFLPDLVPLSSSFDGHLAEGHALYDGERGTLSGLCGFPGGVPSHGILLGMTRAGKSAMVIDYLSQTDCLVDFRAVIDEGLSYGTAAELLGARPVVLETDGRLTLNPFDTQGGGLTRLHLGGLTSLLVMMAGVSADADTNARRRAMLSEYVVQLYDDAVADWCRRQPDGSASLDRWSLELEASVARGASHAEALAAMVLERRAGPVEFDARLRAHADDAVLRQGCRPGSREQRRDIACALFEPSDFPTLGALWELLRFDPMPNHRREEVEFLASMLSVWTARGPYGCFFDGASNLRLEGRFAYFELGRLPRTARELKAAALYHVFNYIRQHVLTLPRALSKEIILEEPARYLGEAGVEDVLEECYAQLGKFGCRLMPVTQQYAQFARSRVRPVVFGNSSQFWLMRQNERKDLDDLARDVDVPEPVREAVVRFPRPVDQAGPERFSSLALVSKGAGGAECGILRNAASREMLYVSESAGGVFDERQRIGADGDLLASVLRAAAAASEQRRAA